MTMTATSPGDKPASKSLVVIGFVCATLFTTIIGGFVTFVTGIESAKHQAYLQERTALANQFAMPAEAFDPLVVKFVAEVRDGRITPATKAAIKANLLQQRSALENAGALISPDEEAEVRSYIDALVAADEGAKRSTGPLDSGGFARAAVDIATLRPDVLEALRSN